MSTMHRRPSGTLFGVRPAATAAGAKAAVLGVPFDMGSHPSRIGGRGGPAHIRAASLLVAESAEDLGINPIEFLGLVDLGDVDVVPGQVEQAFERIAAEVGAMLDEGAIPVTLGGDGAVTLPQLREAHRRHPELVLIHLDAHTDAYDLFEPQEFNNANSFVHAAREGIIDVGRSFHVGIRDTELAGEPGVIGFAEQLGYRVLPMRALREQGVAALLSDIREAVGSRPVYLCWDMDVFDPSVAPGVVTPAWGGVTITEGLELLRGLAALDVVVFDVNTVSPTHDLRDQTGSLAAHVVLEFLKAATARAL
ncbi:arginase family protein [Leucobacter tenebrionis]|uniref:arginase family protein n=1 Tax=Leucobacter tenebrionis TaxID=2873270 RepID=UPI001CA628B7|nr:arginase family protein [Leucobacter tenebrionis]QZY53215.1 arginase family protein [Leucobacter tenebrionis]